MTTTTIKPHSMNYHFEEIQKRISIINLEPSKLDSELAATTAITEAYTENLFPGGLEAAVAAEIRRQALAAIRDRTSNNLSYYHERSIADYHKNEGQAVSVSAKFELADLVRDFPTTKETFIERIASLGRTAIGLKPEDRAEKLAARDDMERQITYLDELVAKAEVDITRYSNDPTPHNFTQISGAIGMLANEIKAAAIA